MATRIGTSQPDRNNFGPRFGFAYNPNAFNKKLVVRGGFGVYFNRIYDNLLTNVRENPPNFRELRALLRLGQFP